MINWPSFVWVEEQSFSHIKLKSLIMSSTVEKWWNLWFWSSTRQMAAFTRCLSANRQSCLTWAPECVIHIVVSLDSVLLENRKMLLNFCPLLQPYVWTGPSISTCSPPMETATEKPSMCIWIYVTMTTSEATLETLLEGKRCEDN